MAGVILTPGVDSPCVARCSTALGDAVCKGCGRTFEEVTFWNVMDETQKQAILARIASERAWHAAPTPPAMLAVSF
jgi:hypothetical protein